MKNIAGLLLIFLFSFTAFSQDIILKRSGEEINAKVIKISTIEISYKKSDNPDGPEYIISKAEVFMVKYANGQKDLFNTANGQKDLFNTANVEVKKTENILPKNSVFAELGGNGVFLSLNYERLLYFDKCNFIALKGGFTPAGNVNAVNITPSFNIGNGNNYFELGAGGGYIFSIYDGNSSDWNYFYFTPVMGYRKIAYKGFLFKMYLSLYTEKSKTVNSYLDNNTNLYTEKETFKYKVYPFMGFSFGYSF